MVRDVRRDIAGSAAAESPAKGTSAEPAPVIEQEPEPAPIEAAGVPEEIAPDPEPTGTTEQAMDVAEDELEDEPDGSAGPSTATTGLIAEEPIRLDEPEPARSGRSDDEEEGSLRELFWGEE